MKKQWDRDVPFDIKERTFQFGVRVVKFVRSFPKTVDAIDIAPQLVKAGTSVGQTWKRQTEL